MYTIKYNRTTSHIDGLAVRTTGGGNDMGDHVSDYSQNACGSLTRYTFAEGKSYGTVAEALHAAETSGRKLCKTCKAAAEAMITAEGRALAETEESDTMTERNETTTEAATVEQIQANIERAASLVEAENIDGLKELGDETNNLISSLPSRGKFEQADGKPVTFAGLKKSLRDAWRAASQAQPKPEPKPKAEVIPATDYTAYEGVSELVTMGAEKVAEGVRQHIKTSTTAKEIASIILDMWRRIPNKDGDPDITGTSDPAKKSSGAMYRAVGEALAKDGLDAYDVEQAVKKLMRAVQTQRTDVRAEYLRSLDEDTEEAAEERKHFARLIESNTAGGPVSEFLAAHYQVGLKGEIEKARERYHAAKLEGPKREAITSGGGEGGDDESDDAQATSPDDEIRAVVRLLRKDVAKAKPESFEAASDETKTEVREELEALYKAIKDMITATL